MADKIDKIKEEPKKTRVTKKASGKEKKYESYTTDEGQLMVPMFDTSGQFRGYKEKKQTSEKKRDLEPKLVRHIDKDKPTPVRLYRGPDTTQDKGLSRGGRATHGYGKAYLKGGRVK